MEDLKKKKVFILLFLLNLTSKYQFTDICMISTLKFGYKKLMLN